MATESGLDRLGRLVGSWTTEATHPAAPGVVVHGTATVEWLEGARFLIHRARTDHDDFPDSISIIGNMEHDRVDDPSTPGAVAASGSRLRMHYFDSRGVFRVFDVSIDDSAWRIWNEAPGFSQRFAGALGDGGNTIAGQWELRTDGVNWNEDLRITYRRRA